MEKVIEDLSNDVIHMDCYRKGYMLFFKEGSNLNTCKFCEHSRWKRQSYTIKELKSINIHEDPLLAIETSTSEVICIKKHCKVHGMAL